MHRGADEMLIVAVGSQNVVKMNAVRLGLADLLGDTLEIRGVAVESGVLAQPLGDEMTRTGAVNRARGALASMPEVAFGVGLEGGVSEMPDGAMYCHAWCAIVSREGTTGWASTGRCELPPAVAKLIRSGMELGAADDLVFGRTNSKLGEGAVGLLTRGRIDRAAFYAPAVTLAAVRFLNPELYG
jgi:inosine/xanthosine triphosphatase